MTPMKIEPVASQSGVKHSTTEPPIVAGLLYLWLDIKMGSLGALMLGNNFNILICILANEVWVR